MLSAFEFIPPCGEWQALGPEAIPLLIGVASDSSEISFRRVRALTVLSCFVEDARAGEALAEVAENENAPGPFRRAAILAQARAEPSRALPMLERILVSSDPLIRQVAVKALAESDRAEARAMLAVQQAREQEAFLVEALEAALGRPPVTGVR
jgi:hypothetical protein